MDREEASPQPQEPRLSIMHLLVWTACVAGYFSFDRVLYLGGQEQDFGWAAVLTLFYGLGMGTALAGLALLVSRRLCGFPLAKHPGEYLLLATGVSSLDSAMMQMLAVHFDQWSSTRHMLTAVDLSCVIVGGLILLIAAIRVKVRRWRVFFVIVMITAVLQQLLLIVIARSFSVGVVGITSEVVPQIATVALMVVVLMDLCGRKRYPWQHWLGVGLRLWFSAFTVGQLVYFYMLDIIQW